MARAARRQRHIIKESENGAFRASLRRLFRTKTLVVSLVCVAFFPPIFFHFRLTRLNRIQARKCGWLNSPPLVCAHGGDSANAFPNTVGAYELALRHQVDCVEIDASRSSDGVLFALHDRDLQRISGNGSLRVGNLNAKEIKELGSVRRPSQKFDASKIPTVEEALKLVSSSVKQVILDAKVGPPSYEKRLAKDILSVACLMRKKPLVVENGRAVLEEGKPLPLPLDGGMPISGMSETSRSALEFRERKRRRREDRPLRRRRVEASQSLASKTAPFLLSSRQ